MRRVLALLIALATAQSASVAPPATHDVLVIVVDGLRPDYVTPQQMPRLSQLAGRGIVFRAHHSVFPTVTRVNAASFVTGVYPETHGLLGNTVYVPAVSATKTLDTGVRDNLLAIERAAGPLLTAPTLGEILEQAGKRMAVFASATSGATYLLDHAARNAVVVHPEFTRPDSLMARVVERFGQMPPHAIPNAAQHHRIVDIYLTLGDEIRPDLAFVWLSDPDTTAHQRGIGSEPTRQSLAAVDTEIGRIEDTLRARGRLDRTDIIVTSDHGFTTHDSHLHLDQLVAPFAKTLADGSKDIVAAEGAIYFRTAADRARVAAVVSALQASPEVGAIFTRDGDVPGTLPFAVARWRHARSGDILISANWNGEKNAFGVEGVTTQTGVAGHGSASPYDIHNTLLAVGPDFREHAADDAPTGNVDLAPTVLRLLGMTPPASMSGRVIEEGLRSGPALSTVRVGHTARSAKTDDGSFVQTAHFSSAAGHTYLDDVYVVRRR